MAADAQVFRPATVAALAVAGTLAFALMLFLLAIDRGDPGRSHHTALSPSAVGHQAFARLLDQLGLPVVINREPLSRTLRTGDLLILAEPDAVAIEQLTRTLRLHPTVLVVLPKRFGIPSTRRPDWDRAVLMRNEFDAKSVLDALDIPASIARPGGNLDSWSRNDLGVDPTLSLPQLVRSSDLAPVVANGREILLGVMERGGRELWVLSDPDLIATHGLGDGDNAAAAAAMINFIGPDLRRVVIDETIHGLELNKSFWATLFRLPLLVCTIGIFALLVVVGLMAGSRFGTPRPTPPALPPGKTALIENTARLLQLGSGQRVLVARYASLVLNGVGRRRLGRSGLGDEALAERLDRDGRFRRLTGAIMDTGGRPSLLLDIARGLAKWRQDMSDGSRRG